jgi:hypothetical protein
MLTQGIIHNFWKNKFLKKLKKGSKISHFCIRALSAHSVAKFNISPGRWQHVCLVAIVPPERWGKMDRNDCHTAWGNFKTLLSSTNHYKKYAWFFFIIWFFQKIIVVIFICLT